jgi:hypothetical protein
VRTTLRDAARQAALDERDRLGVQVNDYVVGRIVEAALAVITGQPPEPEAAVLDLEGREVA